VPERPARFHVARKDVDLIRAELAEYPQTVLYAPLMQALVAAVAELDTHASRLDTGHPPTTELPLAEQHAPLFRSWLRDAAIRARLTGHGEKARRLARLGASGQPW
jgi:hypothetical protein